MPSIKIIIPLFIATSAIGWALFSSNENSPVTYNQQDASNPAEYVLDATKDSDNDSIKDWEEILWSTNPYTPDTDNDGLTDDVEIAERKKNGGTPVTSEANTGSVRNLITQTFPYGASDPTADQNASQEVMEEFMQEFLKNKYQELTTGNAPLTKEELSILLFEGLKNKLEEERTIPQDVFVTKKEIEILPTSSAQDTRAYLNQVGMVFLTSDAPEMPEFKIIEEIITQDDENFEFNVQHVRKLRQHSQIYLSLATRMRDIKVPANLADAHVDMMNSFIRMSIILEDVMRVEFDPLRGLAAVGSYTDEVERSKKPLKVFVDEIKQQKLSFADTEGGMVFAQFTSKFQ